jgi:hypothetical protein
MPPMRCRSTSVFFESPEVNSANGPNPAAQAACLQGRGDGGPAHRGLPGSSGFQTNRNVPTLDDEREMLRWSYVGNETHDVLVLRYVEVRAPVRLPAPG